MKKLFVVLGYILLSIVLVLISFTATTIGLMWVLIPFGITMGFWTSFKMLIGLIFVIELVSFMTKHTNK